MAFELSPEGGKSYSKGLIACVMAQSCGKSCGAEEVDWIFAFSHRFICWNSSPSGMVFGGRDFSDSGSFCSIFKYFYERLCPWRWLPQQFCSFLFSAYFCELFLNMVLTSPPIPAFKNRSFFFFFFLLILVFLLLCIMIACVVCECWENLSDGKFEDPVKLSIIRCLQIYISIYIGSHLMKGT